jgi:two-component system sensor histidine kinase VicK
MHFYDSSIISALGGQIGFNQKKKDIDNNNTVKEWITYAMPVTVEKEIRYVIYTRLDATDINDSISEVTGTVIAMMVLALLLTGVLGFVLANTLTRPIVALTKQAKSMAMGDLNQEITVYSQDEIGQLTETINNMAKELSHTISNMESEKNKLRVVLDNMTDGVLAYDIHRKLMHANAAAIELLGMSDLDSASESEVLGRLGLEGREESGEATIAIGDKFISSSASPYYNTAEQVEGIVIVIQDVTKHTKLDNMRKEFVANVSHELRTPLATVRSYTETLLDGAMNEPIGESFLRVIDSEAERMSVLVKDLLELSRLDNSQFSLEKEITDLDSLIKRSIKHNSILAEKKSQTISYQPPGSEAFIFADTGRINQVLTNIISNAVKYSQEGAKIDIAAKVGDFIDVSISDNGIGISKDDLKRVFERFYRADKARSREMGGTGLGLAIAKEIMEAHGYKINAYSELGKGTKMVLRFDRFEAGE